MSRRRGVTAEAAFWSKVRKSDGCWEWMSFRTPLGYGRTTYRRRHALAHRISYELNHGPIPDGLCVLHHCDNPPCVNPAHLYAGTKADNVRDMLDRGRAKPPVRQSGSRNPAARLTDEQVSLIRRLQPSGTGVLATAEYLGVSAATVYRVLNGETYA